MESHPEEKHHGKHKTKRGDALARLGRRQFLHGCMPVGRRLRVIIGMLESAAEAIVYKDGYDKRNACHGKAVIVSFGQLFDVTLTENSRIARESLRSLERFQRSGRLRRHSRRIIHILVGKGGNLCIISEAVHAQHVVGHLGGRCGGKQCTDVDGHVEEAERRVALVLVLRSVVEVSDHDLQVAFEKPRAASNQCQRTEHHGLTGHIRTRRDGQQQVTDEHDEDTERNHLAESVFVGQHSTKKRHKINRPEEHTENGGCLAGGISELRL